MSQQLLSRLENFRKQRGLSILALCRLMETHNVTYHRWKKAKKITGSYKKIIQEFLEKHESSSDIAVIGLACFYPGANNIKELWENILARRIQFRRMLDGRLPLSDYYDPDPKSPEKTYITKAALIDNFVFDWAKLRIPKKTFESTDIVHWLALDTALKTFQDAGYKINDIPLQNTGVIVGNTLTGEQTRSQSLRLRWPYVRKTLDLTLEKLGLGLEERHRVSEAMERVYKSAFYPITEDSLAGGLANTIAGRICNYLNLKGGGYIVDGACSSSLLAVATAANALRMGDLDLALAGGVDISLDPFELVGFAKAGALAKDKMQVYDRNASGFIPGEGCGFVVLKRLEDALRDKNYIYAVIKGWGISSDGKGGIMEPSSNGQALAIERAYKNVSYKVADIDFIEGHGTGTAKGDRVELEGIAAAITKQASAGLKRIYGITSFKSIVGHTKAAAGVGGFIKAVLAVNQRILPPTANCQEPNEIFEGVGKSLYPIIQGAILDNKKNVRGGISSAGFGGINCHIALESKGQPKKEFRPSVEERALLVSNQETEVFVFASPTPTLFKSLIAKFKDDLHFISQAEMADLSARLTKNIKKKAPIKVAVVTDSPENLYQALCLIEEELAKDVPRGEIIKIKSSNPNIRIFLSNNIKSSRIGFLYPGQASQRLNMTRVLFERFEWGRELSTITKTPIAQYIYKPLDRFLTKEERTEFEKELSQTEITQLAVTFSSLMWSEFLSRLGIEPQAVGGHSLGELSAFFKAGALSQEELLRFAEFRGQVMAASGKKAGAMVSLLCSHTKAKELVNHVKGNLVIANINSPSQIIISGDKMDIEKIIKEAKKEDIANILLPVSNAFHSSFMQEASHKIKESKSLSRSFIDLCTTNDKKNQEAKVEILTTTNIGKEKVSKPSKINLYSGMNGKRIAGSTILNEYFSKQVVSAVNFVDLIGSISKECDVLIEVGPGRVLTDLVKSINKDKGPVCLPVEGVSGNDRDWNLVLAELFVRNISIRWEELYKNRLIRPFIPVFKRTFIVNQCERPLKVPEDSGKIPEDHSKIIQSVIHSMIPAKIDEVSSETSISLENFPSVNGHISETLIHFVERLTGFSKDSIQLNLRLLDDLNLDSIKAAELIAEVAKALNVAGEIEPAQYSNKTLDEIRQKFEELVKQKQEGKSQAGTQAGILKRYSGKTWVRNFVERFEPQTLKEKNPDILKTLKNILIICEAGEKEIARKLKEQLLTSAQLIESHNSESGGRDTDYHNVSLLLRKSVKDDKVGIVTPDEINVGKKPECVIAILPGNVEGGLTQKSLHEAMERLYKMIAVAINSKHVLFVQLGSGDFKNGSIRALSSTLHLERPDLRLKIIDFDRKLKNQFVAEKILEEFQNVEDFVIAGYAAKGERQAPVFEVSNPASYKERDIRWSKKDVVLVTGGAKGITAECALEFGRMTKATMALMGRSAQDAEIEKTLGRFKEEKLSCQYLQCDVTDTSQIKQAIKEVEKQFGPVTAVIHGAGLNSLRRLKQAKLEDVYQESLPKIMGGVNVIEALKDRPLKLFAVMASIIGVTGMEGSGWYGFANEILLRYLRDFKISNKAIGIIAPAFSVWDEVGMGIKLGSVEKLSARGIGAIPVSEGIKRFRELIERDPQVDQVIITSRVPGLDTMRFNEFISDQKWRFIEEVKYYLPQVELIAHAHLNVKDDPYVIDHNWKGSLLFPMVFGLEAMTQAACYVTGTQKIQSLRIKNINLERPISVSQESGTTIEVHAQVLETENTTAPQQVKVEIYCEQTNYKEPHFSAVLELNPAIKITGHKPISKEKLKAPIDLDLQTDVYGPILFQGKMFQRIDKIYGLFYNEKIRKGECLLSLDCSKSVDQIFKLAPKFQNHCLIGDPFCIDSMLQSIQLIIPQDMSLPRKIDELDMYSLNSKIQREYLIVKSCINKISDEQGIGGAKVYSNNRLFLEMKNCDLKILRTILDRPSANDLVDSSVRDQKIIENRLKELANKFNFELPVIKCTYDPNLRDAPKNKRHQIELPLIKEAVGDVLKRNSKSQLLKNIRVKWLKIGKPIVQGIKNERINLSLSHDGSFLIVIAGYGEQGCDVETVKKRSPEEWLALLGKDKLKLLQRLIDQGSDMNESGAAIWSAAEAIKKAKDKTKKEIVLLNHQSREFLFNVPDLGENIFVINFEIQLTLGGKKICSLVVSKDESKIFPLVKSELNKFGYDESVFKTDINPKGPQGGPVYIKRFPVTFKNSQNLSKSVYFTNFFEWMGTVREYALYPIVKEIIKFNSTGEWGLATNSVRLRIIKELKASDVLESHLCMSPLHGKYSATFNLMFDWFQVLPEGNMERVAISEQRLSWVKITGHGEAHVETMPSDIKRFLDSRTSHNNSNFLNKFSEEVSNDLNVGKRLFNFDNRSRPLHEHISFTTLEDSNLIGNIYFSNYAKWLGIVENLYFYQIIPDYYKGTGADGEFICTDCEVKHFSEAMPFDKVLVKMYLDKIYRNGLDLDFEFFSFKEGSIMRNLATAKQKIIWVKHIENKIKSINMPAQLIKRLCT